MQGRKSLVVAVAAFWIAGFLITAAPVLAVSQVQVLHAFTGGNDGAISWAGLIFDASGNLYGTTIAGGTYGYGTVFKLTPGASGAWTETVLHSFNPDGTDGNQPEAELIFDVAGNLYGTTSFGGSHGEGTVFRLAPGMNGTWTETVLHAFNGQDGGRPSGSLIFDAAGNLYGTTNGTPPSRGNVFKLTPGANGKWTETVLHSFSSKNGDGAYPYDSLILDAAGNVYGTTYAGGNSSCFAGCGIIFKLTPGANSNRTETALHSFTGGADGGEPYAGLTFDTTGSLYGTTNFGGGQPCPSGCGVVFKLKRGAKGKWPETVLHSFNSNDGEVPYGNVIFDAAGGGT